MKKCPYCAEEIQNEAIKCKHCGEMLKKASATIEEQGRASHEALMKYSHFKQEMPIPTKPKKLTWLWWTLGIIIFFSIISIFKPDQKIIRRDEGSQQSQQQEDYSHYQKSNIAITIFMSRVQKVIGGPHPQKQVLYPLGWCRVFQKISNGYLLIDENSRPDLDTYDPLFIETNEEIYPEQNLFGREAYYVGEFQYTSINGFDKRIYAFRLVPRRER